MKFRKVSALFMAAGVGAVALAGCAGSGSGTGTETETTTTTTSAAAAAAATETEAAGAAAPGQQAGFEEFPVGDDLELDWDDKAGGSTLNVAGVYFQPVDLEPSGGGLAAADASFHIEADISAGANNVGYEIGTYVPQLTVDYEIAPADANAEKKEGVNYAAGTFMDMNASDGPHYGANVKLTEAGSYKVKFTIKSPEAKGWVLHTDAETGVDGRFWSEPLVAEWDWDYVPQEWNN